MACPLCAQRKPKRYCPATGAKICSLCCGTEREVTIDCPFDCRYLEETRERDYKGNLDPKNFPHKEIRIDERFLSEHEELLTALGQGVFEGTLSVDGAADRDAQQALDAQIQTFKTLSSGIHYESRPDSLYARSVYSNLRDTIQAFQQEETEKFGFARTRDSDIVTILVFLYRMALDRDNGRTRGKAFLDFLRLHFRVAEGGDEEPEQRLIVPGV
jgi:hypothetical protein